MMRSRAPFLRGAVALLGFVLVAGCMDATLLQTQSAEASISIQQAPDGISEVQLTVSGPGMSTISRRLTPNTESLTLEIPVGPDRVFEASAGGYSARVVRAVTAGGVNIDLLLSVPAEGTLLFARGGYSNGAVSGAGVFTIDASGVNEQQLTNFGGSISGAGWTPDGNWVLFVSQENLYRVRADGSEEFGPLTGGLGTPKYIGGFGPNGTTLAYSYETGNGPAVFTIDVGDANPAETEIATQRGFTYSQVSIEEASQAGAVVGQDVVYAWSPDGVSLLYSRDEASAVGAGLFGRLYVTSDGGQTETPISVDVEAAVGAQWLPVGSAIVYAQTDTQLADDMDIYIAEYDGSTVTSTTQLTDSPALDRNLRISPDGSAVLFERYDTVTGASQYVLVDVASGAETPLTDLTAFGSGTGFFGFYPVWIQGTNEIAVLGIDLSTSATQIRIYSSTGAELDVIEIAQLGSGFPSQWSSNGQAASVMVDESGSGDGTFNLYVLSRATGELSRITDTPQEAEIGGYWRP